MYTKKKLLAGTIITITIIWIITFFYTSQESVSLTESVKEYNITPTVVKKTVGPTVAKPTKTTVEPTKPVPIKTTPKPTASKPDLEITHIKSIGVRTRIDTGVIPINVDIAKINFTIKNTGSAITKKFYVDVYIFESNNTKRIEIDGLTSGESFTSTVSFRIALANLRVKPIIIKVDPDNRIKESNENNNKKEAFAVIVG